MNVFLTLTTKWTFGMKQWFTAEKVQLKCSQKSTTQNYYHDLKFCEHRPRFFQVHVFQWYFKMGSLNGPSHHILLNHAPRLNQQNEKFDVWKFASRNCHHWLANATNVPNSQAHSLTLFALWCAKLVHLESVQYEIVSMFWVCVRSKWIILFWCCLLFWLSLCEICMKSNLRRWMNARWMLM